MDKNSLFSALSLVSVYIYMHVGFYTYKQNMKSIIHKVFFSLCTSYAVWSFAYAFAYVSSDKYIFSFWNKVSAIGWCSFSAISLYFVLLITENRIIKKRAVKILIFSPAVIFFYMAVFLFGADINTFPLIINIFYYGDFLYNFLYLFMSIIIIFVWGIKSDSVRIKKQSRILVLSSIIPFCLNLFTQSIMPLFGFSNIPLMGQLYSVIMIIGTYIVITRYKFLRLPERFLFEEIEKKAMDMIIFTNEKYEIVRVSRHTLKLLDYEENELMNKNINCLFSQSNNKRFDVMSLVRQEEKYKDIEMKGKFGQKLPANITYIPIIDSKIHDFLGAVFIMQDISAEYELRRINQQLHEKTIRDGLTKLYNHQYSVEIIQREIGIFEKGIYNDGISLMMIDIDFFKKVNDTYGHLFGDYVLETVSEILVNNIGENGYVGRFGGEEFIIILPQIGLEKALYFGEKIRSEIEAYEFKKGLKLTVSIGIKQLKDESSVELVKNADDLLYKAKQNGRNRIEYN